MVKNHVLNPNGRARGERRKMNHFTHLRELLLVWIGILASNTLYGNGTVTCPGGRNLTASEGILMSPGYSETHYPNSTVCIWVITAPQHWKVKLMINSVDLEYCAMCSCDYVELRDGAKASGPLISRYCEAKASTVYSEGRHMWVKFESDRENEGRGFLANYTFIKLRKKKPVILKANRTSQFITSSKNPTVCGSDRQCTWVITAPEGFQVQLTTESFVFLSCLGSFIEIKDGPTCSSPMIGKFCGNEKPPLEICSLGNSLLISFKYNSTRDLEMNRFELMYRATRANITPQRKFYDEQAINSDHWRSMAVGIACTSFFLFVILVACFLKIASNRRFAGLEQTTSQTELNPTDSIVESTFSNDINESLLE